MLLIRSLGRNYQIVASLGPVRVTTSPTLRLVV
jgi:hypothetical protein